MAKGAPIEKQSRIIALDVLRGFAVLGILIMNMISFSSAGANYLNPMAEGELQGLDEIASWFSQLFASQKFISLFSILFGAGIVLMTSRMESKGLSPGKRHFVRNFWLLILGLAHAYLLWIGDILVSYALCSVWVYLFRNRSVKTLLVWGGVFFSVSLFIYLFAGFTMPYWSAAELTETCESWLPSAEAIAAENEAYRGSWLTQMTYRVPGAFAVQTMIFLFGIGWQITGLMLLGMALYKSKVITAERSRQFYVRMLFIGFGVGLAITVTGLVLNYANNWSCNYSFFIGSQFNYLGSVPMALGYIALFMLFCKSRAVSVLEKWLAPVGRMALSNYLFQSVLATFIFYGHGLGLFGTVGRAEIGVYTVAIWIEQILFSRMWMSYFKFGPAEWLWRSLTYGKLQRLR